MHSVRRALVVAAFLSVLLGAAACGGAAPRPGDVKTVTIVGQRFTEADVMTQLYRLLLQKDGFRTTVKRVGAREIYLGPLERGEVQVSADYLASMTEALNRKANGEAARPVASSDVAATLASLRTLGAAYGITPLRPAAAEDGNAYAVTREYAAKNGLTTLTDLAELGKPVALAGAEDCAERQDCALGLTSVYGIKLSRVEPLGLGSADTTTALTSGRVQLAQVGTTDGTLEAMDLVVLDDDRDWQPAENLVPLVNADWLEENPRARKALERLSAVLTTADLTALNAQVDADGRGPGRVAEDYLTGKGLL